MTDANGIPDGGTSASFPATRCASCGELYGHRPSVCRACGSETFDDESLPGEGRLYASTTIRVPGADHQGQEPFAVGLVDVGGDERVRVTARLDVAEERAGELTPESPVTFVEERDGAFVFRPA